MDKEQFTTLISLKRDADFFSEKRKILEKQLLDNEHYVKLCEEEKEYNTKYSAQRKIVEWLWKENNMNWTSSFEWGSIRFATKKSVVMKDESMFRDYVNEKNMNDIFYKMELKKSEFTKYVESKEIEWEKVPWAEIEETIWITVFVDDK